jgi:serine protease Do
MTSRLSHALVALILGLALLAPIAAAQQAAFDAEAIYLRAAPAIAIVRIKSDSRSGLGTAFAIDPRGVLVTAAHVARGAEQITVEFGEGSPLDATLVGYDARRDLAILRAQPRSPLPSLEVVESSSLQRGDPVLAIGTPRGRPRVMTMGAVLGTGLTLPGLVPGIFVLFDATVEPGNSGGPLLNDRGQVVGVVVALTRRPDGVAGLATASSALRAALPALANGARLERAWLGISGTTAEPEFGRSRGGGVVVLSVLPDSPASKAGLRAHNATPPGDIIIAIDGAPVDDWEGLLRILGALEPGQRVRLGIIRDGLRMDIPIALEARP